MDDVKVKNFVGIDLGKKMLECVRINPDDSLERFQCKTGDISLLIKNLKNDDVIALEAGNQAFRIAKQIMADKSINCEVIVLNPGDLAMIYNSLKKTDKEDALKLARLIKRIPKEELPVVDVPTDTEEDARRLSTEQSFWTAQIAAMKNRLHALFTQAGMTNITKKDIAKKDTRLLALKQLSDRFRSEGERLVQSINETEEKLEKIDEETRKTLNKNFLETSILMSMPGIGPLLCLVILAYIGDGRRFSKAKQVSHYAGLTPRVDISGDTVRYGSITKRGCLPIRRIIIQGAWALTRSKHGGALKSFYELKKDKIGKKKAIVAVARKMLETIWVMLQKKEFYNACTSEMLDKKLALYGIK